VARRIDNNEYVFGITIIRSHVGRTGNGEKVSDSSKKVQETSYLKYTSC